MSDDPIYLQQTLRDALVVLDRDVLPHMRERRYRHDCPDCQQALEGLLIQVSSALSDPNECQFVVSIDLGNDAMLAAEDIAEALVRISNRLTAHDEEGSVIDANGNTVGRWSVAYPSELAE